ncbi:SET and MYND domain-containing protein 4 [Anoplopoma fimbria]|uniref:SET and MYND domain-containing protein 4 n=1 Tax=Anoplopoma fimbria TaxID=229290 RepID=UPI0023EC720D|nr:SET and MYND domain-containing protein 4 [Anoplopoma fimbria]XP_054481976.1 SET and MYND domain-containing protein 4 [Anoplopoma fimbria]
MMDLPCVQWQDHVAQKWIGLDPELKETFTSLLELDDLFKCAQTLITQDDLDFVQSISSGYSVQKDAEQAATCREVGNSSFKTRDYTAASLHYSQGICFALQGSEQLSLCYANRSATLYHLQHYQESLDDIDKALKNGYPSHLSHKLKDRRTQCLKHLSVGQKAKEDHHNPASNNPKAPDRVKEASVGLLTFGICPQAAVGFSLEKGRHLVAKERIAAGEVVLHDRPYSCVLIPGMEEVKGKGGRQDAGRGVLFGVEHRHCHRCLTETLRPVPCEGCSYSRYCSTSCQQDAWEEHHRWECPLGAHLRMMGVMSQLALRVTLKAGLKNIQMARDPIRNEHTESEPSGLNGESSDSCPGHSNGSDPCASYYGDSYPSVFHLRHHLNRHSPDVRFLCAVTIATLFLKLSKAGPPPASWDLGISRPLVADSQSPDKEEGVADWSSNLWLLGSAVLRHMLQLRCNAQAVVMVQDTGAANSLVQPSREIRIATAIFPTLSLLNHSCCPNTSLVFSAGTSPSADFSESMTEYRSTDCGVTMTVRASKVITAGKEILHCYGPHSNRMATQERRRLLQEQYYFLCRCEACTLQQQEEEEEEEGSEGRQQWSGVGVSPQSGLLCGKCKGSLKKSSNGGGKGLICSQSSCAHRVSLSEVNSRLQEIKADLEKAVDLMERERPDEALTLLRRTQSQPGLSLAETHPVQGELEDATARAYATMGDWNNAASHLERSAVAIGSQYGEDSIELSQQLFKLAQLHFNGGARGPALSVIPKVRQLLCLHGGPLCHELQELHAMEKCLQG